MRNKPWAREELIFALSLYFRIPFGRLHSTNPEIIDAARLLGRTPAAVSMKLCNFARFDPSHMARNVKGLGHGGKQDEVIWSEFYGEWELLAEESFRVVADLSRPSSSFPPLRSRGGLKGGSESLRPEPQWDGHSCLSPQTETISESKQRIGQDFFRRLVLSNFNYSCAITGVSIPSLLIASHIIPWAKDASRRVNPSNGICLTAIHDRAFDKGLITLSEDLQVVISRSLKAGSRGKNPNFIIPTKVGIQFRLSFPRKRESRWIVIPAQAGIHLSLRGTK